MKFYYYAIMIVGLMIVLGAAGYDLPITGGLMKSTGLIEKTAANPDGIPDGSGFKSNDFWSRWAIVIGALSAAGIIIGAFSRSFDMNVVLSTLIGLLSGAIIADYIWVMSHLSSFNVSWIQWSMGGLFSILIVGFFVTMIEFLRGTD